MLMRFAINKVCEKFSAMFLIDLIQISVHFSTSPSLFTSKAMWTRAAIFSHVSHE